MKFEHKIAFKYLLTIVMLVGALFLYLKIEGILDGKREKKIKIQEKKESKLKKVEDVKMFVDMPYKHESRVKKFLYMEKIYREK